MLRIIAVNGSPRKEKNTGTLLKYALKGFCSEAPDCTEAKLVHLYDYQYTGCKSCFECKKINGKGYGRCSVKDDLLPILDALDEADAIVFGSPVYLTQISGQLQCLMERFLFPKLSYDDPISSIAKKRMHAAFVYTMNVTKENMKAADYERNFAPLLSYFERLLNKPNVLYAYNTLQFDDYARYHNKRFSPEIKREWHEKHFPVDCENAFALGKILYQKSAAESMS